LGNPVAKIWLELAVSSALHHIGLEKLFRHFSMILKEFIGAQFSS
jgi:hypothetical protein